MQSDLSPSSKAWEEVSHWRALSLGRYGEWVGSVAAYLYILPALLIYGGFFLWPWFQLVQLSLYRWDGMLSKTFVGLENYRELLFSDPRFWQALQHNVLWMLAAVVIPLIAGLFLAILLVRSPVRGRTFFRTIYFLPQVLSSVVVAIIWRWIYNPNYGALNKILETVGLSFLKRAWLGDMDLALPALFIAWSWVHYGFSMVIFIAALQGIDEEYFDVARVDGANWFQQLRYVILPFIRGPLTTVMLITAIAAFQIFDLVFIVTHGGPGYSTNVLSVYMYDNAFRFAKVGYGATVAMVLGMIILMFSIAFLRLRGALREEL